LTSAAHADDTSQNLHLGNTLGPSYNPNPALMVGSDGNIYGTAAGFNSINGSVFQLSADGATYTTIYPFTGNQRVLAGLAEGPDGALYGTIYSGQAPIAMGAVFKVTKTGVYSTVHAFAGGSDGANPDGPLLIASDGTIYGTTYAGGASAGNSWGTIFSIDSAGTFSTIYDFSTHDGTIYGTNPRSRLIFGTDGTIYGTATIGGSSNKGTIFALALDNSLSAVSLDSTIGQGPHDLLQACDGFIYGRAFGGNGVIFKMNPVSGTLAVLHALLISEGKFDFNLGDGNATGGALVEGLNHSLYGAAHYGGSHSEGSVFELALDGTFTVRVNATNSPWGVLQGPNGNLYGTAVTNSAIFEVTLPDSEKVAGSCPAGDGPGGGGGTTGAGGATGVGGDTGAGGATGTGGDNNTGTGGANSTGAGGTSSTGTGGASSTGTGGGGSKSGGGCSLAGGTSPLTPFAAVVGLGICCGALVRRRRVRR
jgi:uncharacterized repeat protein (TIGR03803 family)